MRCNTFGRSALFAALAGFAVVPWLIVAAPLLGLRWALAVFLLALTVAYAAASAPSLQRGVRAAVLVAFLGGCVVAVAHTLPELALGLAVLLGVTRSVFLYRQRSARTVAVEVILIGGGLLFARFLAGSTLLSVGLGIWGFLLVQSLFFLVGDVRARGYAGPQQDPFDAAHERARALLEGLPV